MTHPTWIFDLDNTLHNATPHIFPHINRSMTAYLQTHLQLDEAAANALRMDYWQRYGATLSGLVRHHAIDPDHFLWHTHQFPALPDMVLRQPRLRHVLRQLAGKKIVFTNAPRHYAIAVLKLLQLSDLFEEIFSIEDANYQPKPHWQAYKKLLRQQRLVAAQCVMVEDSADNLRTAKRLGMQTIWISNALKQPSFVDFQVQNVIDLPRVWRG
jgi:putative hydrolase of the HAD superfamily